jgi:phospholipase/carboxylesterase
MARSLDGPRLKPISGKAKQLVVILHGYGADGNDLIEIGRHWQKILPDAAFVSPHAHEPCAMAPGGRQWFRLTDRNPHERWSGVCSAHPVIDSFIDEELAEHGLTPDKVAICGFSQGAMMALHVGLRRKVAPAGIIGLSGTLVGPENLADATARSANGFPPPVLIMHGHMDEVIPVDSMFMAADQLAAVNIPCQWHLAIGLGHGIDGEEIRQGAMFLARCFGLPTPALSRR